MATTRTIHVVGTGTIGEPLLGLLLHTQRALEVDEITFHKHSPRLGDRAKVTNLMRRGARLAVDAVKRSDFEKLGLQPAYTTEEALTQATVVIGEKHQLSPVSSPPRLLLLCIEQMGTSRVVTSSNGSCVPHCRRSAMWARLYLTRSNMALTKAGAA